MLDDPPFDPPLDPSAPEGDRLLALEVAARENRGLAHRRVAGVVAALAAQTALLVIFGLFYGHHLNAITVTAGHAADKANRAAATLRAYEIASCKRGNERTVGDNVGQRADYRFFSGTARILRVALKHPTQPSSAGQTRQTLAFVRSLESDAADKMWHHLIKNCETAVDHPATYKLPPAVPFAKEEPPPGALRIERGE